MTVWPKQIISDKLKAPGSHLHEREKNSDKKTKASYLLLLFGH